MGGLITERGFGFTTQALAGAAPTWDLWNGSAATLTMGANTTLTVVNAMEGVTGRLVVNPGTFALTIVGATQVGADTLTPSDDNHISVWIDGGNTFWQWVGVS